MSEHEQCKERPGAINTRKLKSMKITWVQTLGREHSFYTDSDLDTHTCLQDLGPHLQRNHSIF